MAHPQHHLIPKLSQCVPTMDFHSVDSVEEGERVTVHYSDSLGGKEGGRHFEN